MISNFSMKQYFYLIIFLISIFSCEKTIDPLQEKAFSQIPDYDWVFPENEVKNITIHLSAENWEKIQKDMEYRTVRKFGSSTTIPGATAPQGNGGLDAVPGDPIYVEASVSQNDFEWKNVGFRLKGNASLAATWRNGIYKLPFKLQFDQFENNYPKTKNQRFYGFKELSFAPSFGDNTFMKEKLLTKIFRESGVLACKIAYYKVNIDFGKGVQNCGIYQAIEIVEEHLVENQTNTKPGNVYKPESSFQTFLTTQFEKQNNKELANYDDVKAFVTALNSPLRTSNTSQWKSELEAVFNVKGFLKYLAVNNSVGNWDAYGQLTHNHYLVSINNILNWVPYDLNLSFQMKGGNNRTALTMDMKEVGAKWPLIRYLMDDTEYYSLYKSEVREFVGKIDPMIIAPQIQKEKSLLAPYFTSVAIEKAPFANIQNPGSFERAISDLEKYIAERHISVKTYLEN
jgi:spore coat protein H